MSTLSFTSVCRWLSNSIALQTNFRPPSVLWVCPTIDRNDLRITEEYLRLKADFFLLILAQVELNLPWKLSFLSQQMYGHFFEKKIHKPCFNDKFQSNSWWLVFLLKEISKSLRISFNWFTMFNREWREQKSRISTMKINISLLLSENNDTDTYAPQLGFKLFFSLWFCALVCVCVWRASTCEKDFAKRIRLCFIDTWKVTRYQGR